MVQSKAWLRWGLLIIAAVALLIIGGCRAGNTTADVGVIDISKIVAKSSKAQAYQQQDSSTMNSALKGIVAGVMMAGISTVLTFLGF